MKTKIHYGEFTLEYWIKQLVKRQIVLPDYQRSFVWKKDQVTGLIKSIGKDLFVPPVTIGHIDGKNIIIDGQQRLTSILLSYLKAMPLESKFVKRREDVDAVVDEEEMEDIAEDEEMPKKEEVFLDWSLSSFITEGDTLDTVRKKVQDMEIYEILDTPFVDEDFIKNHYLGFSYILPQADATKNPHVKSAIHKFFSTVFRNVNISGTPLLKLESRRSLYFLDDTYLQLFEPEALKLIAIAPQGSDPQPVDFVRLLAFLFEFAKSGRETCVLKGKKNKTEEYYEEFISHVINHIEREKEDNEGKSIADGSRFKKYSEVFSDINKMQKALAEFNESLHAIVPGNTKFQSVIDADIYLLGAIYYVLLCGRALKLDTEDEISALKHALDKEIELMKKDDKHRKSPGGLKYLRNRISTSVNVFGKHIKK